jgi:hypothetical protein
VRRNLARKPKADVAAIRHPAKALRTRIDAGDCVQALERERGADAARIA